MYCVVSGGLLNYIFNNTLWLVCVCARASERKHAHTDRVIIFHVGRLLGFQNNTKSWPTNYGSHLSRSNLWQHGNKTLPPFAVAIVACYPPTAKYIYDVNQSATTYTPRERDYRCSNSLICVFFFPHSMWNMSNCSFEVNNSLDFCNCMKNRNKYSEIYVFITAYKLSFCRCLF